MAGVAGIEIRTAVAKANDWGTAVAVGVGDGILTLPQTIKKDAPVDVDDSLGNFWIKDGLLGAIKVEGAMPAYLRYDSLDMLIALFMGDSAGSPVQQGGSIAYAQTFKWAESLSGLFCTIARDMKNYILEIPSAKIAGMSIKGEIGKALQISFDVIGINKVADSVINTLTGFNSDVTWPELMNRVKFSEGVFRINAQSGDALDSGDTIYPSSFELTAKRKMSGVYDGQYTFVSGSNIQDLIDEPQNDGLPDISLKLTFPRHTSSTYLTILQGDTRQKMDITFTGALIVDPYYRQFKLELPHLQLKNDDPADAQGRIDEPLEFAVHGASSAPNGMTGITDPFWVSVVNKQKQDMLP